MNNLFSYERFCRNVIGSINSIDLRHRQMVLQKLLDTPREILLPGENKEELEKELGEEHMDKKEKLKSA